MKINRQLCQPYALVVVQYYMFDILDQACQTQTTFWAAKATKTAEGVAKVLK